MFITREGEQRTIKILHLSVMSLLLRINGPYFLKYWLPAHIIVTEACCTIKPQQQRPFTSAGCFTQMLSQCLFNPYLNTMFKGIIRRKSALRMVQTNKT